MKLFKQIPPTDIKRFNSNNINSKRGKWIPPFQNNVPALYKSNSNITVIRHRPHHRIPPIKLASQFNAILQPVVLSNNSNNNSSSLLNHQLGYKHLYNMDRNKGLFLYLTNHKHHLGKCDHRGNMSPPTNMNLNMCYNIKPVKRQLNKIKQRHNTLLLMKDEGSSTREDIHSL